MPIHSEGGVAGRTRHRLEPWRPQSSVAGIDDVLPAIVRQVGKRATVMIDSGVRSGSDVVAAAWRAAVLGGKAFYGLGALAPDGPGHVIDLPDPDAAALATCPHGWIMRSVVIRHDRALVSDPARFSSIADGAIPRRRSHSGPRRKASSPPDRRRSVRGRRLRRRDRGDRKLSTSASSPEDTAFRYHLRSQRQFFSEARTAVFMRTCCNMVQQAEHDVLHQHLVADRRFAGSAQPLRYIDQIGSAMRRMVSDVAPIVEGECQRTPQCERGLARAPLSRINERDT